MHKCQKICRVLESCQSKTCLRARRKLRILNWDYACARTRSRCQWICSLLRLLHSASHLFRYIITKTYLYNFDHLKPHFYIVKLGWQGYTLFFLFLFKNIECGYSLEPPRRGGSNEYTQSIFWAEIWKISDFFYLKSFSFWRWNFLYIWIGLFS